MLLDGVKLLAQSALDIAQFNALNSAIRRGRKPDAIEEIRPRRTIPFLAAPAMPISTPGPLNPGHAFADLTQELFPGEGGDDATIGADEDRSADFVFQSADATAD